MPMPQDARRHAPSAERNRDAILAVLRDCLPARGVVLEIASGSGEHAVYFAAALPELWFQPSDPDPASVASIDAWSAQDSTGDVPGRPRPALLWDTTMPGWPVAQADAVLCINMVHIAPWPATLGLLRGAAGCLPPGGPLVLYGPYRQGGRHTTPSNAAFDADLRGRDARWGVRDLEAVSAAAAAEGFGPVEIHPMPANNLLLVYRRHA